MAALNLRPYQDLAADFLYARDRALILAPVGAGKTAITLTAMRDMIRDGHAKRFLVLAPKRVATSVWPKEAALWAPELSLVVCVGVPIKRAAALRSKAQIVVANYDTLQWLAAQPLKFDAIVFDELTRLKNPSGTRFKALHKIIERFPIRWGLTGSFTSNGLEDVFGQCKIVNEALLGRAKGAFMQQYFALINREYGQWEPRTGSLEAVMARIKPATFLLEPGDYKDTLPPLHIVPVACDMDRTLYEKMKRDFVLQLQGATVTAASAGVVSGKLTQLASGFIYETIKTARADAPGKFHVEQRPVRVSPHKFDVLDDLLVENQHANTILVYAYQEQLAELKRRYPHLATLDDPNIIDRWNAGGVRLLALHPDSAAHGLNLQHGGNHLVFLTLPWSWEKFEQTIGRLHRSGQRRDVWCYLLLTDKTVDEKIWGALQSKRDYSAQGLEALK